ncbi:hypothetical protein BLA29_005028 [Euroglyphus maynei]|uniref:CUE domain-containing protein n=1 Tax=Euroglyphus maynei TaxID=6958 RepID=A0A1Y3BS50_EURMA|nr:hypothetical protein BLA29_005028 [Euroglyphus maynei]
MVDESLFYKIKQSFPHIEPECIRKLLIQHDNREHPTIEALLNLFGLFNTTRYKHSKRPQLKLKYLKFAFPDIDEIVLLDLLFQNEFDASRVIKHLKLIGHEHSEFIEIKMSKLSETALLKEANERLQAPRPKSLIFKDKYHPNLWEQEDIRKNLIKMYPSVDIFLVNWALEATRFDIKLASTFLDTMTPQDDEKYLIRTLPDKIEPKLSILVSRQVQTNSLTQDLFGRLIIVETFDEDQEFEKQDDEKMLDKSTWTKEDGIIIPTVCKLAHGPDEENQKGPDANNRITKRNERLGPISVRIGADFQMRQGPQDQLRTMNQRVMKMGAQKINRKGAIGRQIIRWKERMRETMKNGDESIYFFPDANNENNHHNNYIVCCD